MEKVLETYEDIASEFSKTRNKAWPEFEKFKDYVEDHFKILDLGCGNGRLFEYLGEIEYIGVDISEKLLKEAKKRFPKGKFIKGDQLKIPAKDEEFDIVFNIAAFHHIPSRKLRRKALDEMHRVLKKDGILILTVWNLFQKKYIKHIARSIVKSIFTLGKYDWNDTIIPWGKEKKDRYYHAFTERELRGLLKSKFEVHELDIGNNIFVVCKKK